MLQRLLVSPRFTPSDETLPWSKDTWSLTSIQRQDPFPMKVTVSQVCPILEGTFQNLCHLQKDYRFLFLTMKLLTVKNFARCDFFWHLYLQRFKHTEVIWGQSYSNTHSHSLLSRWITYLWHDSQFPSMMKLTDRAASGIREAGIHSLSWLLVKNLSGEVDVHLILFPAASHSLPLSVHAVF